MCGRVDATKLRDLLAAKIEQASRGAFLLYFTGYGFDCGDDIVLADSGHDPDYSRRPVWLKQDVLRLVEKHGVKHGIILLDCPGIQGVERLRPPIGTVVVANPGKSHLRDRYFARILLSGLGGEGEPAPGSAWDVTGTVSTLSWLSYALNAMAARGDGKPLLVGTLDSVTLIKRHNVVNSEEWDVIRPLFNDVDGELIANVEPDMEYDQGIGDPAVLQELLGWSPTLINAFSDRTHHEFSYRTRPPIYHVEDRKKEHPKEFQQQCLKKLIKSGLAEVVVPEDRLYTDLYWACMAWGQVRLTGPGVEWFRSNQGSGKTAKSVPMPLERGT